MNSFWPSDSKSVHSSVTDIYARYLDSFNQCSVPEKANFPLTSARCNLANCTPTRVRFSPLCLTQNMFNYSNNVNLQKCKNNKNKKALQSKVNHLLANSPRGGACYLWQGDPTAPPLTNRTCWNITFPQSTCSRVNKRFELWKKRHFSPSKIHTAINGRFKFSVFSGIVATFIISICCRIEVINITMVESQGRGADFFSIGGKVPWVIRPTSPAPYAGGGELSPPVAWPLLGIGCAYPPVWPSGEMKIYMRNKTINKEMPSDDLLIVHVLT